MRLLFLLCFVGCSVDRIGWGTSAIVGGSPSPSSQDDVVLLLTEITDTQGTYVENCTATLVAPNLILTARHCISPTPSGTFVCNADGSATGAAGTYGPDALPLNSLVFVGPNAPAAFNPSTAQAHGTTYFHDSATAVCNADVALVEITPPITTAPIAPLALADTVTQGESVTVVGWGATEDADLPSSRVQRAGVTVVMVGPGATTSGGALGDREFIASESVCSGDSGGPAFDSSGALVGVVSRGPVNTALPFGQGCIGTQHTFMKTASFQDLITTAFTAAGDGLPTQDAGALDASGTVDADADAGLPPAPQGGCAIGTLGRARGDTSAAMGLLIGLVLLSCRRQRS